MATDGLIYTIWNVNKMGRKTTIDYYYTQTANIAILQSILSMCAIRKHTQLCRHATQSATGFEDGVDRWIEKRKNGNILTETNKQRRRRRRRRQHSIEPSKTLSVGRVSFFVVFFILIMSPTWIDEIFCSIPMTIATSTCACALLLLLSKPIHLTAMSTVWRTSTNIEKCKTRNDADDGME